MTRPGEWAGVAALAWLLWPVSPVELAVAVLALAVLDALTTPPKRRRVLPSRYKRPESEPGGHTEGAEHDARVHP